MRFSGYPAGCGHLDEVFLARVFVPAANENARHGRQVVSPVQDGYRSGIVTKARRGTLSFAGIALMFFSYRLSYRKNL